MTDKEAIKTVLRAAESNANGNGRCAEIHAAIERVEKLFAAMLKRKAKCSACDGTGEKQTAPFWIGAKIPCPKCK